MRFRIFSVMEAVHSWWMHPWVQRLVHLLGYGHEDVEVRLAFWVSSLAVGTSALLILFTFFFHMRRISRERRQALLRDVWMRNLLEMDVGTRLEVEERDLRAFLEIWIHLQESLRGDYKSSMAEALRKADLLPGIRRMVGKGRLRTRVLACLALGHLRDADGWKPLIHALQAPSATLSLAAARSVVLIDAAKGFPLVLDELAHRSDWPMVAVEAIVTAATSAVASPFLIRMVQEQQEHSPARIIMLLSLCNVHEAETVLAELLHRPLQPEQMVAALGALRNPVHADLVRSWLHHEDSRVRGTAARALGRIGGPGDTEVLAVGLTDRDWAVRYSTAQALLRLPGMGPARLRALPQLATDRYARDMVEQVVAEQVVRT